MELCDWSSDKNQVCASGQEIPTVPAEVNTKKVDKTLKVRSSLFTSLEPVSSSFTETIIRINDDPQNEIIGIKKEGGEIYFPWVWVEKYFDVFGHFDENEEKFLFKNSYSAMSYKGDEEYTPMSAFMTFGSYRVESRERVKLISGVEGVPISTQWSPEGYFYPVQIAQYGLAAYSRNVTSTSYECHTYTTSCGSSFSFTEKTDCNLTTFDKHSNGYLTVCYDNLSPGSIIRVDHSPRISTSTSIERVGRVEINYVADHVPDKVPMIDRNDRRGYAAVVTIGIGIRSKPGCITRDILTDALKGLGKRNQKSVRRYRGKMERINTIKFIGRGKIDSIKLAKTDYDSEFENAAIWLRDHQNEYGIWPIEVAKERIDYPTLQPGWTSAMAQGHGISMMVRAANVFQDPTYWEAAGKALEPFKNEPKNGGVRNYLFEKYVWYEEYPFVEGLFVLNGFMYALIGLYDLSVCSTAPPTIAFEATTLFQEGLLSLRALLPLFDAGKGSFYDLGHIIQKTPPNLARWDYHTVHVQQLRLLNSFLHDQELENFAFRWEEYTKGNYAAHN